VGWVVAERYAYTSSIALSIMLAWIMAGRFGKKLLPFCMVLLAFYAIRTIDRNADYKTDERFRRATVEASFWSSKAQNDMGVIYARESNVIKAAQSFNNALKINPDNKEARKNLDLVISAVKKGIHIRY